MKVAEFDFELPRASIADRPASPRDSARLLAMQGEGWEDHVIRDLPQLLEPGDILVFNDTKVIPARLFGRRKTASVEVTLHQPVAADRWRAFARPARKLNAGDRIDFAETFSAEVEEKGDQGEVLLAFDRGGAELLAALDQYGVMPLPPYIHRPDGPDERDRSDYQTIFAAKPGAVAAPTAALHFTPELLSALDRRGVKRAMVTLHVGAGTFLPVKSEVVEEHVMHAEFCEIDQATADTINAAHSAGGRIVAVGTTSLRLLESAADESGQLHPFKGETRIFITPGYRFKLVDRLMTNFHLPRSTLFMLVCAFAGMDNMKAGYRHAIDSGYRFYSYGDACLLTRKS